MNRDPIPLSGASPDHIALPRAPLWRVIAQIRYPTILAIGDERRVADFQEQIRKTYPILEEIRAPQFVVSVGNAAPNIQERPVWRFTDRPGDFGWRVSLATDFLSLETRSYERGEDFLARLRKVVTSLATTFEPTTVQRFGMRYIDRVKGEAFEKLDELIKAPALGILQRDGEARRISDAVAHILTQAELLAEEGRIQARWGAVPADGTYDPNNVEPIPEPSWLLDLDMFSTDSTGFDCDELMATAGKFRERIYDVFRAMVRDEFLVFYGGAK